MRFSRPRLNPFTAAGIVLLGAFSVQYGSALAVRLFPIAGPGTTVLMRVCFAAVVVCLAARPRWSRLRTLRPAGWLVIAGYGASMSVMNLCFYHALQLLPLGATVTIEFLGPLTLALISSRRALDLLWAGLALVGVAMITGFRFDTFSPLGVIFALSAGAAWAVYLFFTQRTTRLLPMREGLSFGLVAATAVAAPFGLGGIPAAVAHPWVLLAGLGVALLSTALPYGIDLIALTVVPAGAYGVLMSLEPAVAALSGLVVLGQRLTGLQWLAILMVVAASAGSTLAASRQMPGRGASSRSSASG